MNWADIKQWDSAPLQEYALECERKQRKLQETGEDLSTELSRLSGQGQTADAARNALRKRVSEIEEQVNYLISAAEVASAGVQGINEIRANIEDVQELAKAWNIQVDSSGEASLGAAEVERLFKSGHSLSAIKKYVDDVQARINSVLTQAQKLVDSLSQKIYALHAGAYDNGVHYSAKVKFAPTLPPAGASAQEVASWWSSLSDKDKQWMIENYPEQIGNLDGVDFTSRDKANRIALPQKIAEAEQQLADYERELGDDPTVEQLGELKRLHQRLQALRAIGHTLKKEEEDGTPRFLLGMDTSGPNVLAAVSQNNPDTADHVGVIVPGMTTNVADSLDDYDNKASTMRKNVEKYADGSVAIVEYFNYDAPQDADVISTDKAQAGAQRLAGFLNGLDASREHGAGDAHVTVAAHSYGSTTAGIAATKVGDGVIDDLVQFGSPGSGVQDVGELHVPKGHAWVSAAPYRHDMVQGVGPDATFGKNPDTMPGYRHLSGDVGDTPWHPTGWGEHSSYFKENTKALDDISRVIAGKKK